MLNINLLYRFLIVMRNYKICIKVLFLKHIQYTFALARWTFKSISQQK